MRAVGATILALSLAAAAAAQTTSGSLSGTVADATGAVLPGATVTLIGETSAQVRAAVTNEEGLFVFPALVPGPYTVRVEMEGFQALERTGNQVVAGGRLALGSLQLQVGDVTDAVTVTAQGLMVETDSSSVGALLDTRQLEMISLRGRDPITMLRILPGVQQGEDTDLFGGSFATGVPDFFGTGGQTIYVDGVNGGDGGGGGNFSGATNLDAIAEVKVELSNYRAEYGRSGGPQINFITKRGGSEYHGSAYWYGRHERFNANDFFNNMNDIPKPLYRFRTLGGTLGGPAPAVPGLNPGGDKLFFFYSLDDTQAKLPTPLRRWTMPTALERQGDFSQSRDSAGNLIVARDPLTGGPFPGNKIPADRMDPHGRAIMDILPLPNVDGDGYNFQVQHPSPDRPRRQHVIRVDVKPTAEDSIGVKYQSWFTKFENEFFEVPAAPSRWGLVPVRYDFTVDQGTIDYTKIISSNLVNEFNTGVFYSTENGPPVDDAALASVQRQNRGLGDLPQFAPEHNPLNIIPEATFGGLPHNSFDAAAINYDGRFPIFGADTALTASNNLTYIRGRHTFKAGIWWEMSAFRQARSGIFAGQFNFAHNSNDPGSTGYAFANAYIGHFQEYEESLGRVPDNRVQHTIAWFVQDTWKVTPRLTLDIGLRMYRWGRNLQGGSEASIFSFERFDPTWGGNPPVLFEPTMTDEGRRALNPLTGEILPQTYVGAIVPGTGYACNHVIDADNPCDINGVVIQENGDYVEGGRGFIDPIPIQFDPRFGLAWDPFGDGKTAVRASVGVFHSATGGSDWHDGGPAFQPENRLLYGEIDSLLSLQPVTFPIDVEGPRREDPKQALTYQYSVGIQRDIGWSTVLDIAYVGHTRRHLTTERDYNMLPPGVRFRPESIDPTTGRPLPDDFLRPIIGFGDIEISHPALRARYDSLQVQANRRFLGGVEFAAAYTYANGMEYGQFYQLDSSLAHERDDDVQTHVFNFSYTVDVPDGSRLIPGPVSELMFDGWQVSGISTFASGFPMNVSLATTDNFDFSGGGESCGVVQTGSAKLPHGERTFDRWFDTSVFQRPSGRGDLGNNCHNYKFRGPGFNNHDISVFKNFRLGGDRRLQFRWELYNAFNHTQFANVNTTARFNPAGEQVNSQFGRVTSTRDPRRMQFSLRFSF